MDLQTLLPRLIPRAITWAEVIAADVASRGAALDVSGLSDARTVGVQRANSIRVLMVDRLPLPSDSELQAAALQTGLLGPEMAGLTLGYPILIYLESIVQVGYWDCPFEQDARTHEQTDA